ncbi:chain-length determining protein [Xaviernesmea oryzae]|uniref:Chain-length determining protein n=1 Tax=Xaviernesmea oryzae TaxID=464029 RepID=A0A1Q9AXF1_9HYPH|nr:Wzz/FepE/Etk N-terminal domain-containing protein [Xaviernesmea oryzae]OLP60115.1 chain-length determining protein [Xaviernesmea oryzae]
MSAERSAADVDIDLSALSAALWRRRWRILAATVIVSALAFAGASMLSPSYQGETRLLIESREPDFSSRQATGGANGQAFDDLAIVSQVQVLQSVDLIKQVARNLKLHERKEFDPTAEPSTVSNLLVLLHLKKNPLDVPPEERVLKAFQEKLQVYQVEKSRVIGVQFTSKDRALAAEIPNEMARVYLSLQSGAKIDSNTEASRWLEPEIANLREKVRAAEQKVADYRSKSDLLPTGENSTFATRQLTDLSTELARIRAERANAQARAEGVRAAIKSGRDAATLNEVAGSPAMQRLSETQAQLQRQIADLSITLLDGHPRLKGLKAQLQGVREQMRDETRKVLQGLDNDAQVAALREQELTRQLNTLKANSAKAGEDEVDLRALEREATAQRQLLETYLARYREAASRVSSNATPADARIISSAVEPSEPIFPKIIPITLVAGLGTLLLTTLFVLLAELFSGRALRPTGRRAPGRPTVRPVAMPLAAERNATPDLADRAEEEAPAGDTMQPAAVAETSVPSAHKEVRDDTTASDALMAEMAALDIDDGQLSDKSTRHEATAFAAADDEMPAADPLSDRMDDVAARLLEDQVAVAVCLSPGGEAGSAATVALARYLADSDRRTVLVDLSGAALPSRLMIPGEHPGITDLLTASVAFGETIHADQLSDAHIIPQGQADPEKALKGAERLTMIIDALASAYEIVLIDCGDADPTTLARLTRVERTRVLICLAEAEEDRLVATLEALSAAGYEDAALLSKVSMPQQNIDEAQRHQI